MGLARWLVGHRKSYLEVGSELGRGGRRKTQVRTFLTPRRKRGSLRDGVGGRRRSDTAGEDTTLGAGEARSEKNRSGRTKIIQSYCGLFSRGVA